VKTWCARAVAGDRADLNGSVSKRMPTLCEKLYLVVAVVRMWITDAYTSIWTIGSTPETKMTKMGKEASRR